MRKIFSTIVAFLSFSYAGFSQTRYKEQGLDYVAKTGTLTFAPGVKRQTFPVTIIGNRIPEPDETFSILLSNPVNATIADNKAIGTIINDDGVSVAASVTPPAAAVTATTMKVSPNPASTTLYVQLNGYKGNVTLQLRSMEGQVVRQEKIHAGNVKLAQHRINVSDLATGTYLLTVIDEKGDIKVEKVIIAR